MMRKSYQIAIHEKLDCIPTIDSQHSTKKILQVFGMFQRSVIISTSIVAQGIRHIPASSRNGGIKYNNCVRKCVAYAVSTK